MRIARIIIAILLVSVSIILSACSSTTSQQPSSTIQNQQTTTTHTQVSHENSPANITTFSSAQEGTLNRFYFLLEDADGKNLSADGHVQLQIFDDSGTSLYSNEFDVKASEYVDYQFKLTGQYMGKAYEWRVPVSDIKKGISSIGWGRAVLTFNTVDGKELTAEDKTIQIPTYTDDELKQMAEAEYTNTVSTLRQTISKGNFEITVTGAGFFSPYEYGARKEYFRVDTEVRNVGSEADYFSPSGMVILDNQGYQYELSYGGSLDTFSQIYPNVTKKGYILFKGVPKTLGSAKLMFQLGYDAQFKQYLFEFNIPVK